MLVEHDLPMRLSLRSHSDVIMSLRPLYTAVLDQFPVSQCILYSLLSCSKPVLIAPFLQQADTCGRVCR